MRRHLARWITDEVLREMNDRYEGRIESVVEERLNNRWKAKKELQPVIKFDDGWQLCPNIGQRRALIEFWGPDTENWIGRRLVVYRHRNERRADDGLVRITYEKRVMLPVSALKQAQ